MIALNNISQYYGAKAVLKQIDLEIDWGGVVVIIGPNGIGKSTLLRVMAGILSPQLGTVTIDNLRRRSSLENELAIRQKVFFLPDESWMPARRTPIEWLFDVGQIWNVPVVRLADHIDLLLDLFDLTNQAQTHIGSLSTGQKKKVSICSALVSEARWMLLDEPFSGGLDSAGIFALCSILNEFKSNTHSTSSVIITTPVAELIAQFSDRVIVLRDGRIAIDGSLAELRQGFAEAEPLSHVLEQRVRPDADRAISRYLDWKRTVH